VLIRLCDDDRKRLGIDDEWIGAELTPITVNQAIVLQHDAGYRGGPDDVRQAWNAQVADDGNGGQTFVLDARVWKARVWLAVNRYGCKVAYAEFDFDMSALDWQSETPAESGEGKDDSTPDKTSEP
jgi:hypothetical protein